MTNSPYWHEISILFLGGPIHGEVKLFQPFYGDSEITVPEIDKPQLIRHEEEPFSLEKITYFKDHRYRRQPELEKLIGKTGMMIYEHESLCDENVKKRAERLDTEIGDRHTAFIRNIPRRLIEEREEIMREWGI